MKKAVVLFFLLVLFIKISAASLGISPAKFEVNFEPNHQYTFKFEAIVDEPDSELEAYVEGDLSQYATLNKRELRGGGSFEVTLNLPAEVEKAGKNTLIVGVREIPGENEFIATSVNIRAIVNVYVPYPGKYVDVQLNVGDGNINEVIPVELHVINRGKESIEVSPIILFFDSGMNEVERMNFQSAFLNTSEERYFRKYLNTTGFKPDNYLASSVVNYGGEIFYLNQSFRIGSLFVNITDFTKELKKKGIQKYLIDIESGWNSQVSEVFADVNLTNGVQNITFRTPSAILNPWEKKTIEGFLDTDELEGRYNASIILSYERQKSFAYGTLAILESNMLLLIIIGSIAAILIVTATIIFIIRKKIKNIKK